VISPKKFRLIIGRVVAAFATCMTLLFVTAGPAAADGGKPTSYESVVDTVRPAVDGFRVEVKGGDAFLEVSSRPATEVLIPGYDGEPYLRIKRNGVVERNVRSPATYLNQSRSSQTGKFPAIVDSDAAPKWEPTGGIGRVAWHDHRIHWMVSAAPEPGPGGLIQEWMVPFTVNGRSVTAEGRLLYRGSTTGPMELIAVAAVLILATLGTARFARRRPDRLLALFVASIVALGVGWSAFRGNPPDAGASLIPVLVAVAAMLLVAVAPGFPRLPLALASAAALAGWAVMRIAVLWKPVLPTTIPGWIDRVGTAAVLGVAIGVAYQLVRFPTPVDDPEPPEVITPADAA